MIGILASTLSLFGGFAILIIAFIFIEQKVEEPIISFEMFKQQLIRK